MWKIRISVLWIYLAVAMSAGMVLWLMGEGVIEEVIEGTMEGLEISHGTLVLFALFWIIPLTMAFMTLVLEDKPNRWSNLILGIFFAFFYAFDVANHLSEGGATAGHILMGIVGVVVAAMIFWHGWKWPVETPSLTGQLDAGEKDERKGHDEG